MVNPLNCFCSSHCSTTDITEFECHKSERWSNIFITLQAIIGAICSSVVRAFAHGVMGRRIDPSWGGSIELFLVLASASRLV